MRDESRTEGRIALMREVASWKTCCDASDDGGDTELGSSVGTAKAGAAKTGAAMAVAAGGGSATGDSAVAIGAEAGTGDDDGGGTMSADAPTSQLNVIRLRPSESAIMGG